MNSFSICFQSNRNKFQWEALHPFVYLQHYPGITWFRDPANTAFAFTRKHISTTTIIKAHDTDRSNPEDPNIPNSSTDFPSERTVLTLNANHTITIKVSWAFWWAANRICRRLNALSPNELLCAKALFHRAMGVRWRENCVYKPFKQLRV